MGNGGHHHPDSLQLIEVSGKVKVDDSQMNLMYFLDEDGDDLADYHLNFGPYWYHPDSSNAIRPNNGDQVTITGGIHDSNIDSTPTIIVYEINNLFWRDPIAPSWNYMDTITVWGMALDGCMILYELWS
jgi:hypothetical protein